MSEIRVLPLPKVTGVWQHDESRYPEIIRVPMSDGRVISYRMEVEQPAPVLREQLDRFEKTCFGGYGYKVRPKRPGKQDGGGIIPGQMSIEDMKEYSGYKSKGDGNNE